MPHLRQLTIYQMVTTEVFRRSDRNNRTQLLALSLFGAARRPPFPGVGKGFPRLDSIPIPSLVQNACNVTPITIGCNGFAPVSSASQPIGRCREVMMPPPG